MRCKFCVCGEFLGRAAIHARQADSRRLLFRLAFANAFQRLEVSFGLLRGERVLDSLAISTQVDRIEDGERAADTPHESNAESNQRCRTKGRHTLALRTTKRLSDTLNQFRICG